MEEDPQASIDGLRKIIIFLESKQGSDGYYVVNAQLNEVSRAISKLEAANVPVPESLRKLKLDLVAEVSAKADIQEALGMLSSCLDAWLRVVGQEPEKRHKKPRRIRRRGTTVGEGDA